MRVVIGIDPDSKASGVAVYINGNLDNLRCMELTKIYEMLKFINVAINQIEIHIENVCANNAVFMPKGSKNPIAEAKARGRTLGMCQQVQTEIERMAAHFDIPVVKHKISKAWKSTDSKKQFEAATGWKQRSNEDTRSAAYFGMIGVKSAPLK